MSSATDAAEALLAKLDAAARHALQATSDVAGCDAQIRYMYDSTYWTANKGPRDAALSAINVKRAAAQATLDALTPFLTTHDPATLPAGFAIDAYRVTAVAPFP
jgi:hypothetical protein